MSADMALDTTGIDAAVVSLPLGGDHAGTRTRDRRALDHDRLVVQAFARAVQRCEDPAAGDVLDRLCSVLAALRPHPGALIDAFGIPERQLAAGIGRGPAA